MQTIAGEEWNVIESLLPAGWVDAAKELNAFQRVRRFPDPGALLRLLLFHAANHHGLRSTVAQARAGGLVELSQVALFKRLKSSTEWLRWIGTGLAGSLRETPRLPEGFRLRAVDSSSVQGPASKGTDWRIHYVMDLLTLNCDWVELTDAHGGELLERVPMQRGDVILGDRNYFQPKGVGVAAKAGAHVVVRMRWSHPRMLGEGGGRFQALDHAQQRLRVGQVGSWPVQLVIPGDEPVSGRVIVTRLPGLVAEKAVKRLVASAKKKGKELDPRSLQAAHFVMIFTTLPEEILGATEVLELYRFRWQIELAFKRLKQLLQIGHLPHKDPVAARSWIHAKLVVALLLEVLYRNARAFSPWGYRLEAVTPSPN